MKHQVFYSIQASVEYVDYIRPFAVPGTIREVKDVDRIHIFWQEE